MLEHIVDHLEQNEDITGHYESDEVDGFIQTLKELAEKLFKEIKEGIADAPVENQTKRMKFIKALIRIFSILLNANLSSAKIISKVIKQSVKLVLSIWQKQGLDKVTKAEPTAAIETEQTQDTKTMARTKTTPRRGNDSRIFVPRPQNTLNITDRVRDRQLTDITANSGQIKIVNRNIKPRFKIKKLILERKTVQIKKNGQVVKTINVNRKSYYFDGVKAKRY